MYAQVLRKWSPNTKLMSFMRRLVAVCTSIMLLMFVLCAAGTVSAQATATATDIATATITTKPTTRTKVAPTSADYLNWPSQITQAPARTKNVVATFWPPTAQEGNNDDTVLSNTNAGVVEESFYIPVAAGPADSNSAYVASNMNTKRLINILSSSSRRMSSSSSTSNNNNNNNNKNNNINNNNNNYDDSDSISKIDNNKLFSRSDRTVASNIHQQHVLPPASDADRLAYSFFYRFPAQLKAATTSTAAVFDNLQQQEEEQQPEKQLIVYDDDASENDEDDDDIDDDLILEGDAELEEDEEDGESDAEENIYYEGDLNASPKVLATIRENDGTQPQQQQQQQQPAQIPNTENSQIIHLYNNLNKRNLIVEPQQQQQQQQQAATNNIINFRNTKARRHVSDPATNQAQYHNPESRELSSTLARNASAFLPRFRYLIEAYEVPTSLPFNGPLTVQQRQMLHQQRLRLIQQQQLAARNRRDSRALGLRQGSNSALTAGQQSFQRQQQQPQQQQHYKRQRAHRQQQQHRQHRKHSHRYCSARDPAQLAFEAPTVIEGKIISMTSDRRANFSVTFVVKQIFKQQFDYRLPEYLRLQFVYRNGSGECDIYREQLKLRGYVRNDQLEIGRRYLVFGQQVDVGNFTILGQPIRRTNRAVEAVLEAVGENYAQQASIKSISANNLTVEPGKELSIICRVRGKPPPKVTWFKDHKSINRNRNLYQVKHFKKSSELIIRSFNISDAGRYECRAKNKVNRNLERRALVIEASKVLEPRIETHMSGGTIDSCPENLSEFCFNGGTCKFINEIGPYYYCICVEGFLGERCDRKEVNDINPNYTQTGYMADDPDPKEAFPSAANTFRNVRLKTLMPLTATPESILGQI